MLFPVGSLVVVNQFKWFASSNCKQGVSYWERIFALREFQEAGINLFLTPNCQGRPFWSAFPGYFRICVIEGVKQFLMRSLMLVMNEGVSCDKTMFCCHSRVTYHIFQQSCLFHLSCDPLLHMIGVKLCRSG